MKQKKAATQQTTGILDLDFPEMFLNSPLQTFGGVGVLSFALLLELQPSPQRL